MTASNATQNTYPYTKMPDMEAGSGAHSTNKFELFFDLPAEIRTSILEHIVKLPSEHLLIHPETFTHQPVPLKTGSTIDLFLVCSQMYEEASAIFYSRNRIGIDLKTRSFCAQLTRDGRLLSPQGQDARRRIRHLAIHLRLPHGDLEHIVCPAMADMILHGSLRGLEVRFFPYNYGRWPSDSNFDFRSESVIDWAVSTPPHGGSVTQSSPFQALLRILADPDLDRVELWVWNAHWTFWCPFHEGAVQVDADGDRKGGLEGIRCHHMMKREGKIWAKIDWRRLVQAFGDSKQITRVSNRR